MRPPLPSFPPNRRYPPRRSPLKLAAIFFFICAAALAAAWAAWGGIS